MIADILHHCRGRIIMRLYSRDSSERVRKAVWLMWFLVGLTLAAFCASQAFAQGASDDFNDNTKDPAKWGTDEVKGRGQLNETRGRLEYVVGKASSTDSSDRPWILTQFPYNADWSIQIDATNNTYPAVTPQWSSFGINVRSMSNPGDEVEVELAAFPGSTTREFYAELQHNGMYWDIATGTPDISATIRIAFNSTDKVFTVSYYADPQWIDFGSFGISSRGGGTFNADWGLTDNDRFAAYVFGYSNQMTVSDGEMYGDNFQENGGVESPRPQITGPSNVDPFDTCSYFNPPLFQWTLPSSFQKLELQFYTPATQGKPTKVKVKDPAATELLMPANTWKKILGLPGPSGGDVNCKIVGTNKGEPAVESDVYTINIAPPAPVELPVIDPTSKSALPTLGWGNACATKFKIYFSPDDTFSRKKTLSFNDKNPLDNGEVFSTTLTQGTWNAIRKVIGDEAGLPIYWYVESWDALKRYQRTGNMQFTLLP